MGTTACRTLVRSPELTDLRAFCAAVDLASIGRAARLLQVSQPALSKRLRTLEVVAGTSLLERSTRGVTPTASGAQLYRQARVLLADAEAVEALMLGFCAETVPVGVAASPTMSEHWLPSALVDWERGREHHLSVELVTANSARVRKLVRDGSADLGLAAIDPAASTDGLSETVVCGDEIVVAIPRKHPWAQLEQIDPEQLAATPVIQRDPGAHSTRVVEAALHARGLAPATPLAEIGSTAAARAAALAACAPVLLSRMALGEDEHELVARPVAGLDTRRRFALLHPGSIDDLTPPARTLARHLIDRRPNQARPTGVRGPSPDPVERPTPTRPALALRPRAS